MCPGDWTHVVMLGGRHLSTLSHLTSTFSIFVCHFHTFWWWWNLFFFNPISLFQAIPFLTVTLIPNKSPLCHHAITSSFALWPSELEHELDLSGPSLVPDEILLGPILCRPPPLTVSSWVCRLRYVPKMSFRCTTLHPLALTLSLCLLEQHSLPRGGSDTAVPFRAERSTIMYSQHFFQLWVSALMAAHRNKKLLWRRVHLALICGYKHVCVESIWQRDHLAKMW